MFGNNDVRMTKQINSLPQKDGLGFLRFGARAKYEKKFAKKSKILFSGIKAGKPFYCYYKAAFERLREEEKCSTILLRS
eukprot:2489230-Rhodomonas_salina.1